ncbi:MAG: hypothetical protein JXR75_13950 [Rhodobacteraceae bacterium]|nr:hypothetical protein [Paracoccaceae bacterium]
MTIRLVVDGRGTLRRGILDALVAQADGRVEIALHLGDRDADFHAACLQRMEVRNGKLGHLLRDHQTRGADMALLASPGFQNLMATAVDQMHRGSQYYNYRSHNLVNLQDYLDYYHIVTEALADRIAAAGATHALFMNMPHLGYDTMLYQVARGMGLKTLVLCQTTYSDRFFSMERIEDMGQFDPRDTDAPPLPIKKGDQPDLFYMDDRWQTEGPRGRITRAAVANYLKHIVLRDPASLLRPDRMIADLRRISAIYGALPDWRDPFAKFFHRNEMPYYEKLASFEGQAVDYAAKFVYIPLHNQPEMSTSALGGVFRDQALMVETVARHLPQGWRIYVKENPRQNSFARGPLFWHRLSRLPSVQILPSHAPTHELTARAQLTATVAGTAGWEALIKGRPALVFGGGWWKSFPGVSRFHEGIDLQAVAATTFPHEALEHAAGQLIARCHDGVIELLYSRMKQALDERANVATAAKGILDLLEGRVAPTFRASKEDPCPTASS